MSTETQPKKEDKKSYKETLNLPQTGFAMEAKLVQNEPARLENGKPCGVDGLSDRRHRQHREQDRNQDQAVGAPRGAGTGGWRLSRGQTASPTRATTNLR